MKSGLISTAAIVIAITIQATGLEPDDKIAVKPKSMAFRLRPEALAVGVADVLLDIKLTNKFLLILAMDGGYFWPLATVYGEGAYGFGGGCGLKWQLTNEALKNGWYLQSLVRILGVSTGVKDQLGWRLLPSVDAGYAWYWPNGFWLCSGLSAYLQIPLGKGSNVLLIPFSWWDFGIGYAW